MNFEEYDFFLTNFLYRLVFDDNLLWNWLLDCQKKGTIDKFPRALNRKFVEFKFVYLKNRIFFHKKEFKN